MATSARHGVVDQARDGAFNGATAAHSLASAATSPVVVVVLRSWQGEPRASYRSLEPLLRLSEVDREVVG